MDAAYVTALAALAGSVVGSATSIATTFLSYSSQRKIDRQTKEADKRERLYGLFIDQASKLLGEVIRVENDNPSMMVEIAASLNRMRLFATNEVITAADAVIVMIVKVNAGPHKTLKNLEEDRVREITRPLVLFSEACRRELDSIS